VNIFEKRYYKMGEQSLTNVGSERYKSIAMLLGAAFLWSSGGVLIKLVDLSPMALTGVRSFITALVFLAFFGKPTWNWSVYKIGGAVAYTLMMFLFVAATKLTTAANAILLQYSAPIYIAIFGGWLLKEKATLRDWITIVFVIAGMVLFFMDSLSGGSMIGNILAILSGVAFAFNTMLMRKQKDANPYENVFWGNVLSAIIGIPFALSATISARSWTGLILLGVFQLGVSYILYSKAIKNTKALEATLISIVEPLLNPLWVLLVLGEKPGKWALIGGAVVLASITISCVKASLDIKKMSDESAAL
jgi:drug/metabolite transporter (DMT)-like permease